VRRISDQAADEEPRIKNRCLKFFTRLKGAGEFMRRRR